jgi:hypothetical protein
MRTRGDATLAGYQVYLPAIRLDGFLDKYSVDIHGQSIYIERSINVLD